MKNTNKFVDKFYRLKRDSAPLSFMLASRNSRRFPLLHFDETEGVNKPLRYARNQRSPFEEEQDGNAILEPIVFEDGVLFVPKQNQVLQKFLYLHPQNGSIFEEVDSARDAADELEIVELELEAQIVAKNLNLEKLLSVSRILLGTGVDKMSTTEIKRDILLYAKQEPQDFIETLNDPMLELQDTVYKFFDAGYLAFRNNQRDVYFNLPKNKKKMLTVPFGEDANFIVASYFQSEDGLETFKGLSKRLKDKDN
tara:strand:+ start:523 stop:1281 length:759 start_codon:yes stop_codon:yes gene_type:complete